MYLTQLPTHPCYAATHVLLPWDVHQPASWEHSSTHSHAVVCCSQICPHIAITLASPPEAAVQHLLNAVMLLP